MRCPLLHTLRKVSNAYDGFLDQLPRDLGYNERTVALQALGGTTNPQRLASLLKWTYHEQTTLFSASPEVA